MIVTEDEVEDDAKVGGRVLLGVCVHVERPDRLGGRRRAGDRRARRWAIPRQRMKILAFVPLADVDVAVILVTLVVSEVVIRVVAGVVMVMVSVGTVVALVMVMVSVGTVVTLVMVVTVRVSTVVALVVLPVRRPLQTDDGRESDRVCSSLARRDVMAPHPTEHHSDQRTELEEGRRKSSSDVVHPLSFLPVEGYACH